MSEKEINDEFYKIIQLLRDKRLKEAQTNLLTLIGEKGDWSLRNRLEQLQTSYQYMLQYMRQGTEDPERNKVYQHILTGTWEIAHQARISLLDGVSTRYFQQLHKSHKNMMMNYHMYDWLRVLEAFQDDLAVCNLMPDNKNALNDVLKRHEETNKNLFLTTWGSNAWTREDTLDSKQILVSDRLSSNDRSLFISALTLNLQEYFDPRKFAWLLTTLTLKDDVQSIQRALVGIALTLLRHHDEPLLYPELAERLAMLDEKYQLGKKLNIIYLQLIRAQETEKVNKRISEEIIPEMMKQAQRFKNRKLDLDELQEDEDFNPDWKKAIEDSEFESKLREMNDLQMEGMDVNMSSFSHLKRFPFFNDIHHWFLPFDPNHSALREVFGSLYTHSSGILNMLLQSGMFCHSDKYSMCFLLSSIPEEQREMMATNLANKEMEEMLNEDRLEEVKKNAQRPEIISNLYIQDLYRFYRLNFYKNDFHNPFKTEIRLHEVPILAPLLKKPELLKEVGDLHLKYGHTLEAASIYEQIIELQAADADVFQKWGYCHQKLKNYTTALDAYLRADILKPNQLWTLRHLATCYRLKLEFDKALDYYLKVEEIKPDNKTIIFYTGSCLTELKRYNEALNRFFKLDFMEENNVKAWRAIGWCSFLCGKLEQAQKYYAKVLNQEPNATDYLNAGHVAWKLGQLEQTATLYGKAVMVCGSKDRFLKSFHADEAILLSLGIPANEIPLVLDMI